MVKGPIWRMALLTFILVAPTAFAASPASNLPAPASTEGQEIADFAADARGQYATAVVQVTGASAPSGTNGLPLPLPGGGTGSTRTGKDIYFCEFGTATSPTGRGCRGVNHVSTSTTVAGQQDVDAAIIGTIPYYAVAGPGNLASLWLFTSDTPEWEKSLDDAQALNVSLAAIGTDVRTIVTSAPPAGAGHVLVYGKKTSNDKAGSLYWTINLEAVQSNARPTSVATARNGAYTVVGTTAGLIFFNPASDTTPRLEDLHYLETSAPVTKVAISRDGSVVTALAGSVLYYLRLENGAHTAGGRWSVNLPEAASDLAMSLDGERFAASSGNRVYFYRHVPGQFLAEASGSHDAGTRVGALAYDATGSLLVALTNNTVLGFAPTKASPIWSLKATDAGKGALDAPLRKVTLSDSGERLLVAGRTKMMAYTSSVAAAGGFTNNTSEIMPAVPVSLQLKFRNNGSVHDNYTLILTPPPGWKAQGEPTSVGLAPDEEATVNLTVEAPAGTGLGQYSLGVDVRSRFLAEAGRKGDAASCPPSLKSGPYVLCMTHTLTIPRSVSLIVEASGKRGDKLELVKGTQETIPVTIKNVGNAGGLVNLSATQSLSRGGAPWSIRFANDQVTIPAGGDAIINMFVDAPTDAMSGERNFIDIVAKEGTTVRANKTLIAYVEPEFAPELISPNNTLDFKPGEVRTLPLTVRNAGNTDDVFNITQLITPATVANDWRVILDKEQVSVPVGQSRIVTVTLRAAVAEPRDATLELKAVSQASLEAKEDTYSIDLHPRPADPTEPTGNFLPMPGPVALLAVVGLAALARRFRSGSR